jgi:hypothetical protein
MVELSIDMLFDDWPALSGKLDNLPLDEIGKIMVSTMRTNIDALEGPPRVPPTGDWPLLRKTDSMYQGMSYEVGGNEVFAHPNAEYAKYHVTATARMPARNFVFWSDQSVEDIQKLLIDHLSV